METSYKEKYEQALRFATIYHKQGNENMKIMMETCFPELAESEDEKIRKEIINYFQCQSEEEPTRKEIHDKWIAWLENIPYTIDHEKREGFHLGYKACLERQGKQKPVEENKENIGGISANSAWSEEDETVLNNLMYALANDRIGNNRDEYVDWLKTLRPQNRWKPSSEQIGLLQAIINEPKNAASESCQIVLREVLEQLKKLKEEKV